MSSTTNITCSQALLRFLANQYVSLDGVEYPFIHGMFAIFGHGNVTGLGAALEFDNYGIETFRGNNEQGMAHSAIAFAKQMDRLGIIPCTSSIGPGALNMVTAAGVATSNRIPLLLLPGDIFADRQPDPVLQQIEQPYDANITANDAFKPVSKYFDRIMRPEMLMTAAINAMRVLTCPAETGAVVLALPQDVQCERFDYPNHFFEKRVWHIDRISPSQRVLDDVIHAISQAKYPLIIAGGGAIYSKASEALSDFASQHGIPVAVTQAGKSILPSHHPFDVGGIGTTGTLVANQLGKQADLVLALGTRLQDFTTASKWLFPNAQIIQVNINRMDSFKMDALSVQADVKQTLNVLTTALADYKTSNAYQSQIASLKQLWQKEVFRCYEPWEKNGVLSQTAALGVLNQHLSAEDTVICAAGSLPGDLHRLWLSKGVKDYHLEYGFSCMGYEVAAGLGVSLAKSRQQCQGNAYVVVGDGSFLMMHSELVTSLEMKKKMIIVLFDNAGFQCINNLQCSHGSNSFKTQLSQSIDFSNYAKSLGAMTFKANSLAQLAQALKDAKDAACSVLIEIKVDSDTMSSGYESWWRVAALDEPKPDTIRAY
ncbi:3D-(3,5/4)-trihydroxycyclohexane-1,2-dione acylhydrolase (decyclizing) [Legionella sp. W05-934-2]|uniref:3D-(3,5/4)-trihydroxycyclohexane-1,2-dione acylhydrolase (decyclizing) n=1 Tax=Legionella sp. W05-934-2 TaxID=1198649 RepID=UPI003463206F